MNANDISTILLSALMLISGITGLINIAHFKEFKKLKIENELLKYKLKECEQR